MLLLVTVSNIRSHQWYLYQRFHQRFDIHQQTGFGKVSEASTIEAVNVWDVTKNVFTLQQWDNYMCWLCSL